MNNDNYWLTKDGGSCVNADNSKDACESDNNPNGKGVWVASANVCCYNENASQTCCNALSPSKFWVNNACVACVDDSNETNCQSENNCTFKNGGGKGVWVPKGSQYCGSPITLSGVPETNGTVSSGCEGLQSAGDCYKFTTLRVTANSTWTVHDHPDTPDCFNTSNGWVAIPTSLAGGNPGTTELEIYLKTHASSNCKFKVCNDRGVNGNCATVTITPSFYFSFDANGTCQSSGLTYTVPSDTCCHSQQSSETCCHALCTSGSDCTWSNGSCTVEGCNNLGIYPTSEAVTVSTSGGCYARGKTITVTATVNNSDYTFAGWTVGGDCSVSSATSTTTTITMGSSACSVYASAEEKEIEDVKDCGSPITLSGTPQSSSVSVGCSGLKPDGYCYKFTGLQVTANSTWQVHSDTPGCFMTDNGWVQVPAEQAGGDPGTKQMDIYVKSGASGNCKFKVCNDKGPANGHCATVTIQSPFSMSYDANSTCN